VSAAAQPIGEVTAERAGFCPTGIDELDRVLGGGVVPGGVVLMAGEPGIGKSTLLLAATAAMAGGTHDGADGGQGMRCLYITGEESTAQVRVRADRIGAVRPTLFLAAENDLSAVLGQVDAVNPDVLVVDSIQTITSPDVDGTAGGVSQVRDVAASLIRLAKERGIATLLVGHVTKDGNVAGPRVLEHLVDVVVYFDGDRHARLRMVRAVKNRFGATDEVGCFDLADDGIHGVADPSGLFLVRRDLPVPGTCVSVTLEGSRPLVAEVQALVAAAQGSPRRTNSGLESGRVAMTLAVLESRAGVGLAGKDVYTATVGGVRIGDPACDLAVALAVASAHRGQPLPRHVVAIGEIGLAGDIRPVTAVGRRMQEAARLGFTHAIVPTGAPEPPRGMTAYQVPTVAGAFNALDSMAGRAHPGLDRSADDRRLSPVP
jgi:DNA repair protein RadA/Sms